jgi:hypothetical protein
MGLFHQNRSSKGTVAEAVEMVETYFRHRGLNPNEHVLSGVASDEVGWWLQEGSAQVYIVIQESEDNSGAVLRISAPLVFVPKNNREAFYRRLLDINSNLSNCALSTHGEVVLVIAQRHTVGLVQEEMDDLVWNTAYVGDLLDDKLAKEFGAVMYSEEKARSLVSGNATS